MSNGLARRVRWARAAGSSILALAAPAAAQVSGGGSPPGTPPSNLAPAGSPAQAVSPEASAPVNSPGADPNDIVVTAQFRRENLQRTPLAITAVNGAMLEARGQSSITNIAAQAPNVTLLPSGQGNGSSTQAYIRGIGQSDASFASEPGVGIYIDNVYFGTLIGSLLDLVDLDRVEVLRGPQGTLAGMNSIGGAIKLYSRVPDGKDDGYFEGTVGSRKLFALRGSAGFTLTDNLFLRVSGLAKRQDGYVDRYDYRCEHPASLLPSYASSNDCRIGSQGGYNHYAGRARLRWEPTSRLTIDLIGDLQINRDEPQPSVPIYINRAASGLAPLRYCTSCAASSVLFTNAFIRGRYSNYQDYRDPDSGTVLPSVNDASSFGTSANIVWDLGSNFNITSISAYRHTSADFISDADGTPFNPLEYEQKSKQSQYTQEVRLNGSLGSVFDFTIGGYYFSGNARQKVHLITPPLFNLLSDDPVRTRSKAVFGQGVLHIVEGLNLTGGIRYTDESKTYVFSRKAVNGGALPLLGLIDGLGSRFSDQRIDYRGNLSYQLTSQTLVYAQVSTGFKGGGVNPRPYFQNQVAPFGVESVTAYEGGFKTQLFDRKLRLNAAGFYNDYKNIQLLTSGPYFNTDLAVQNNPALPFYNPAAGSGPIPGVAGTFPSLATRNAGTGHFYGAEAEIEYNPTRNLEIDGSLSYLGFHYDRLTPGAISAGLRLSSRAPFAPRWKASLGAQYRFEFGNEAVVTPRFDVAYQSSQTTNAIDTPLNLIDARAVVNARLGYTSPRKRWEASVYAKNLLGKYYYYNIADQQASYGVLTAQPAPPREVGVTVKRNF